MGSRTLIQAKNRIATRIEAFCFRVFLTEKLNNWLGYTLFFAIAIGMGYLMSQKTILGIGILLLTISLAVTIVCLFNTEAGIYVNLIFSFFAFFISRYMGDNLQVGAISDLLIFLTFLSLFIRKINFKQSINQFARTPVVTALLIVYCYTALQLFNPNANSFDGWLLAFRKSISTLLLFFVAYNLFDSYDRIRRFIIVLFIFCTITGMYGCFQEWFGLLDFEKAWVTASPLRFGLIYIGGDFRKFSTMSDPTAYGILMGACSIFFMALLASGNYKNSHKLILSIGILFMLLGMGYSGTRTANAMIVAGLVLFILLTINKKSSKIFAVVSALIFIFLLYGPINTPTINRFRSTFNATEDASYMVREMNRKSIQPYIYRHPIGGGIGTTGSMGMSINWGHELAGFQPDSGTLKKALETGWIGLTILFTLYFLILKTGINGYFRSTSDKHKTIYAGCICAIFCFYVADYAQVAFGQITDVIVYYPFIAIILKLKNLEQPDKNLTL